MKLVRALHLVLLALTGFGCASSLVPTPGAATQTQASGPTQLPSSPPFPTGSPFLPTAIPAVSILNRCLKQGESLQRPTGLPGALVLSRNNELYLLNLQTLDETAIGGEGHQLQDGNVSPNQNKISFQDCTDTSCKYSIASLNGNLATFSSDLGWPRWLDNERLVIAPYEYHLPPLVRVLNPLTGSVKEISLDLPSPYYLRTVAREPVAVISLDPTLTRAVFFDNEGIGRIILWDLSAHKILAWLPYFVPKDASKPLDVLPFAPGWSPDASQFITTSPMRISGTDQRSTGDELFVIGRDGHIVQLTNLSSAYEFVHISQPRWSPDGHQVAFWLQTSEEPNKTTEQLPQRLAILDTTTREVTDLCLSYGEAGYSTAPRYPVWSPDGHYLAVPARTVDGARLISIVDLEAGTVVPLSEGSSLEGWMVKP